MAEHNTLTDPELHEPIGASTANSQEVYVANGAGSGNWTPLSWAITIQIPDVSTADIIYIPIPEDVTVTKIISVLGGTIAGTNSVVTARNGVASMGTLTITTSGSNAGDIDTLTPVSNNSVSADGYITIETDGASTNAIPLGVTIVLEKA